MDLTSKNSAPSLSTLQELILLNLDHADGYAAAADRATEPGIRSRCLEESRASARAAHELQSVVAAAGEVPVTSGSASASERNWWLELRSLIGGADEDSMILADAVHGEESSLRQYRRALDGAHSHDVAELLANQMRGKEASLQRLRSLKVEAESRRPRRTRPLASDPLYGP